MATFQLQPNANQRVQVWNNVAIPRARFFYWLMALGKLKTKDRCYSIGVTLDNLCPLRTETKKNIQHFYFECFFNQRCLDEIEKQAGTRFKPIAKMDFRKYKLKKVQQQIMSAIYTLTIYGIQKSRNISVCEDLVQTKGVQNRIPGRPGSEKSSTRFFGYLKFCSGSDPVKPGTRFKPDRIPNTQFC